MFIGMLTAWIMILSLIVGSVALVGAGFELNYGIGQAFGLSNILAGIHG